ncbi:MAG: glutamate decarboxylase [Nitrospinae bacterium]|nr:glutamate decarboxylase [Nitrospinota bacterium]
MSNVPVPNIPFGPSQKPWIDQIPDDALDSNNKPFVSEPTANPMEVYNKDQEKYPFQEADVPVSITEVPPNGLTEKEQNDTLEQTTKYLERQRNNFLGYQVIERQEFPKMRPFLDMMLNNIGDPFVNGYYTVNSKQAERCMLDFFAALWHAKWPSVMNDDESYWGYCLSMGSTEGNLYATLNAREYLSGIQLVIDPTKEMSNSPHEQSYRYFKPDAPDDDQHAFTPIAFYTEDTHYSVDKAVNAMGVKTFYHEGMLKYPTECPLDGWDVGWPEYVPSQAPSKDYPAGDGSVDVDSLIKLVEFFVKKGYPPYIVLNYGTTFKGAYDNVKEAGDRLMPILKENGLDTREVPYFKPGSPVPEGFDRRTGYWIHVDGALGASFMPFVQMLHKKGKLSESGPIFDFQLDYVHSIVTSGHKWPGSPSPTGVYMSKQKYLVTPPDNPDYVGAPDSTFAGSRSGFSAMALWELVSRNGYPGFFDKAKTTIRLMNQTLEKLRPIAEKLKNEENFDIWLQHSPLSTSLIFRKPKDEIMFKYSLCLGMVHEAFDEKTGNVIPVKRKYVHMFIFWDRGEKVLEELVIDLSSKDNYDPTSDLPVERTIPCTITGGQLLGRALRKTGLC